MKRMKKIFALLIAMVMVLGMSTSVFAAQTHSAAYTGTDGDGATITVNNAAKGETYKVYKIFDATVTGTNDGSIAYQGTIPAALTDYFEYVSGTDSTYGIKVKDAGKDSTDATKLSAAAVKALKTYVASNDVKDTYLVSAESDGQALTFTNLPYGFYVITSTQDGGAAITVDSTNPNASINDKNTTTPVKDPTKKANDTDVYIGQTVTYTVNFGTANYDGTKQIVKYEIADTLPSYLENVTVTSIKVIETAAVADDPETDVDETVAEVSTDLTSLGANFATAKKITIPWTENETSPYGASKYKNGSTIQIVYTAKVGAAAAIDGNGNKNKVTITYTTDDGTPHEDTTVVEETIYTYAAALQKIDENKKPLAGAKFSAKGLTVSGSAGDYIVTAYDASENAAAGTEMECDAQGQLVIRGLPSDVTLTLTETKAPDGYNQLTGTASLTPVKVGEKITSSEQTIYYDENGKVTAKETATSYQKTTYNVNLLKEATQVVNQKGAELPSTGGIGTTIFYIIGAILVIGAGVVLVTRRRMNAR